MRIGVAEEAEEANHIKLICFCFDEYPFRGTWKKSTRSSHDTNQAARKHPEPSWLNAILDDEEVSCDGGCCQRQPQTPKEGRKEEKAGGEKKGEKRMKERRESTKEKRTGRKEGREKEKKKTWTKRT
ncbi:hypothetical protein Tco_0539470 [Tanacetum coccineum]